MTNEPTIEQMDEAIALFMGLIIHSADDKLRGRKLRFPYFLDSKSKFIGYTHSLEYHTSWDWLMPVVEKISKMKLLNWDNTECADPQDVCYPRTFGMPTEDGKLVMVRFNGFVEHEAETLIKAVHAACYEVAKYELDNQQTTTNEITP